jgi:hypothetical protein
LKGITGGISGGIIALLIGMATFFKKKQNKHKRGQRFRGFAVI